MKTRLHLAMIACVLALTGCSTVEPKIPVGTYRESGTPNFVRVSSKQMLVHIEGVDVRDRNGSGLSFDYVLWSSGRVFLKVTRSVELTYGYPALDYYWDGSKIIAKDAKSNLQWNLALKPSPRPQ